VKVGIQIMELQHMEGEEPEILLAAFPDQQPELL
jgi:hypothetical protein